MKLISSNDCKYTCKKLAMMMYILLHTPGIDSIARDKLVDGIIDIGMVTCGTSAADKIYSYVDWLEHNLSEEDSADEVR